MNSTSLRIGLIGTGSHTREHLLPAVRATPGIEVTIVCSRRLEHARALAHQYGVATSTDRWLEVLDAGVDAVIVCGPPELHAEVTAECLRRGKPVFVEKPPAIGLAELEKLILLEASRDVLAFVDFNFRFSSLYAELQRAVPSPRFVQIRFVTSKPRARLWSLPSVEASYLFAVAIHPLDAVIQQLGTVRELHSGIVRIREHCFAASVTIAFDSGAIAQLDLGNYAQRFESRIDQIGASGNRGVLDNFDRLEFHGNVELSASPILSGKLHAHYVPSGVSGGERRGGYAQALESFFGSVRNKTASASPLSSCRPVYRVIDALLEQWVSQGQAREPSGT